MSRSQTIVVALCLLFSGAAFGQVAYYPFNGDANDESGNGNHGTVHGAGLTTDRCGTPESAYEFDGSGSYIAVPESFLPLDSVSRSVTAWIYSTDISLGEQTILQYGNQGTRELVRFGVESGELAFRAYSDDHLSQEIEENIWYHVAFTYDGTNILKFYVNGQVVDTQFCAGVLNTTLGHYSESIGGGGPEGVLESFKGKIDEVRIYDYSLSNQEVADLYVGDCEQCDILVGHWPMDETSGDTVYDITGNGLDGIAFRSDISTGKFGKCRTFDGDDSEVDFGNIQLPSPFSFSLWTKIFDTEQNPFIFANTGNYKGFWVRAYAEGEKARISFNLQGSGANMGPKSVAELSLGEWYHIAGVVRNDTTIELYVQGVLDTTEIIPHNYDPNTVRNLKMGVDPMNFFPVHFNGEVDEVKLFSKALTPEEIWGLYSVDTLFIGQSSYETSLNPYTLCFPVYLSNHQGLAAGDIPLAYSWPWDADSVSFACTRLETMELLQGHVYPDSNKIHLGFIADFSGSGNLLPPVDETTIDEPIARIFFTIPPEHADFCDDYYLNGVDTTCIQLTGDLIFPILVDAFEAQIVPEVVKDSILISHYRPGDCNGDWTINITDVVVIVGHIFGGSTPACLDALDANCDGTINIADAVRLIEYVFGGGSLPGYECSCQYEPPYAKLAPPHAMISSVVIESDGDPTIQLSLDVSSEIQGVQFMFEIDPATTVTTIESNADGLELFEGVSQSELRVGLLDLEGEHLIPSGSSRLLEIAYHGTPPRMIDAILVTPEGVECNVEFSAARTTANLPTEFSLAQNTPNPFNPSTEIQFSLPRPAEVTLNVYNIKGQVVTTLVSDLVAAGVHTVVWDGTSSRGDNVASGVYFYQLKAGSFSQTRKMLLLK